MEMISNLVQIEPTESAALIDMGVNLQKTKTWFYSLPTLASEYNASMHPETGKSPLEAVFGRLSCVDNKVCNHIHI